MCTYYIYSKRWGFVIIMWENDLKIEDIEGVPYAYLFYKRMNLVLIYLASMNIIY